MGLFGKKSVSDQLIAEHPVPAQYQHLMALGVSLIERDGGPHASFMLYDPRKGKGSKYLFPMWEVRDLASLQTAVAGLVDDSRNPDVKNEKKATKAAISTLSKATSKFPSISMDFSPARIESVHDLGAVHLEYAAYLVRLAQSMNYAPDETLYGLLASLHAEVNRRFASWGDYLISAAKGEDHVDKPYGFLCDGYFPIAANTASAYHRFPLAR